MDTAERRACDEVLEATGDDAVGITAKSDWPAWRTIALDGGKQIDF